MRKWKRVRSEDGSSVVEMAMASIVFLGVLIGIFEIFMAVYSYHYVSYAARDCARYAMVRGDDCSSDSTTMPNCAITQAELQTHLNNLNFPGINVKDLTVTLSWLQATPVASGSTSTMTWVPCDPTASTTCLDPGNQVKVQVLYTNPLSIPFAKSIALNLQSTSTMVIAQ